jgi:hypothetical protein
VAFLPDRDCTRQLVTVKEARPLTRKIEKADWLRYQLFSGVPIPLATNASQ